MYLHGEADNCSAGNGQHKMAARSRISSKERTVGDQRKGTMTSLCRKRQTDSSLDEGLRLSPSLVRHVAGTTLSASGIRGVSFWSREKRNPGTRRNLVPSGSSANGCGKERPQGPPFSSVAPGNSRSASIAHLTHSPSVWLGNFVRLLRQLRNQCVSDLLGFHLTLSLAAAASVVTDANN